MTTVLTPDVLLNAYASGVFPMSESRDDDTLFWLDPRQLGIFDLPRFHISHTLARKIRREPFEIRTNTAFSKVVENCADRPETWINAPLRTLYQSLHVSGFAHALEVWEGPDLVGGVFGIALGGAFFGESMFSHRTDASKIALAYLVDHLWAGGYTLFDTQFITPHLASLGAVEIPRAAYRSRLATALTRTADFNFQDPVPTGYSILQRNSQIS